VAFSEGSASSGAFPYVNTEAESDVVNLLERAVLIHYSAQLSKWRLRIALSYLRMYLLLGSMAI